MGGGGKGYKQNHKYFQQKATSSSTTFLPILCSRLSIEDVVRVPNKSQWQEVIDEEDNNRSVSVSVSGSFSSTNTEDPLSPKIGCMGQVKRSNKIVGFPSSSSSSSNNNISSSSKQQLFLISTKNVGIITSTSAVIKYSKLKKMFSSKNLTAAPTNATTTTASSTRSRGFIRDSRHHHRHHHHHRGSSSSSSTGVIKNIIGEMDPPLPVIIKKVQKAEDDDAENSLWKRRSGGRKASLQNLQLHNITSSLQNLAPTTI